MAGSSIKLTGFDEVLKLLDVEKFEEGIHNELVAFGENVVESAVNFAPTDESHLKQNIKSEVNGLSLEVSANTDYAAYMEFGTRKYAARYIASLPTEWQQQAAKYRGKGGGTFDEFVQNIMAWVQRKGFAALKTKSGNNSTSASSLDAQQQAAYWIALNIIQNGVKPHPFLFPAFEINRQKFLDNLKNLFNNA